MIIITAIVLFAENRIENAREWWNWQTRWLQVPVLARACGFKSRLAHHLNIPRMFIRTKTD